jgi:hypothetical protein
LGSIIAHADDRIDQDREEHAEEDDELVLFIAQSEPQNAQRNPGERRDRPQQLHDRIHLIVDRTPPSHRDADRDCR